jgi:hypothetical protein
MRRQVNRGMVAVGCVRVPLPLDAAEHSSATLSL